LYRNRLEQLPAELSSLKYLKMLDVSENKLNQIPRSLEMLSSLADLFVDVNLLRPDCLSWLNKQDFYR
jgi:Leucine-rich repeat (LRR) protein